MCSDTTATCVCVCVWGGGALIFNGRDARRIRLLEFAQLNTSSFLLYSFFFCFIIEKKKIGCGQLWCRKSIKITFFS